ncbi:VOC family protein [Sphingobium phenoxybenzoativorans]|uniref:VOC family protein n=1 Tax=Sphingobium phenoxybenzoativorans TaxID=1592790 RepID=UPI00087222AA|nr:VOC family protein [Sphingobium phenoxybenzoativorans]
MAGPLYGRAFQTAYVTRDLDGAIARYAAAFGVRNFMVFDTANGPYALRVGLAWAGDRMVEILDPQGEPSPLYAGTLPDQPDGLRFHHIGHLIEDADQWRQVEQAIALTATPVASTISVPGQFEIIYTDSRSVDGHYHEYVYAMPDGMRFFSEVPRN